MLLSKSRACNEVLGGPKDYPNTILMLNIACQNRSPVKGFDTKNLPPDLIEYVKNLEEILNRMSSSINASYATNVLRHPQSLYDLFSCSSSLHRLLC